MRRRHPLLPLAGLLALLALPSSPVRAQDARPGVFGEALDVRVVNVEVVVTDKKGTRVDGLGRDDFALEVDGKPAPIDFFAEVVGGRVAETAANAAAAAPPAADPGQPLGVSWRAFVPRADTSSIHKAVDDVFAA